MLSWSRCSPRHVRPAESSQTPPKPLPPDDDQPSSMASKAKRLAAPSKQPYLDTARSFCMEVGRGAAFLPERRVLEYGSGVLSCLHVETHWASSSRYQASLSGRPMSTGDGWPAPMKGCRSSPFNRRQMS